MSSKKSYANNKKQSRMKEPVTPFIFLLPFIAVLAVIPLIVRYKVLPNTLADQYWHNANETTADLFLYYKSQTFIVLSVILLILLVAALVLEIKKFKFQIEYIPLTIYLVFVLLSTFASQHMYFAINGIENHYESVWVLLGYGLMVFYGAIMADNKKAIKTIIYGWLIGTWALMIIGVFQAFKLDIFLSEWIKAFVLPPEMQGSNLTLKFQLGQVYITLYNPNYVGYFAAITIPVFTILAIYAKERWKKILFAATVIGVGICEVGSGAKNGILALIASAVILLVFFRKQVLKGWKFLLIGVAVIAVVFFGANALRGNAMIKSIQKSVSVLINPEEEATRHLDSIVSGEEQLEITYDGKLYYFDMSVTEDGNIAMEMFDSTGAAVPTKLSDDGTYLVSQSSEFPFLLQPMNMNMGNNVVVPSTQISVDGYTYKFTNQLDSDDDVAFHYLNASGKWTTIEEAETMIFTNNPKFFSGRGYIWARTLPLLKKFFFIGSGPDSFAFSFPHNDYIDSAYVGYLTQIVTKPHSLYLQIGVNTGAISMFAFIAFFLVYFIRSIMLYWKHPLDTLLSKFGIGLVAGLAGYMVSGITNDSTITYAIVFWGLMGVGIAVNNIVRKEFNEQKEAAEREAQKQANKLQAKAEKNS